jgi:hypothetical protein
MAQAQRAEFRLREIRTQTLRMLAADFDSTIRRFDTFRPSQALPRPEKTGGIVAEMPPMA